MRSVGLGVVLLVAAAAASAQEPKQVVQEAVKAELAAARQDQSLWRYLKREAGGNVWMVVETANGTLTRHVEEGGKPASAATLKADDAANDKFVHDAGLQARQRKDNSHDDKSAAELLNLLPEAFTWKLESQTAEAYTLAFTPDPNFHPPDMEARVMGQMAGTLVVEKKQHRIQTMKGALSDDVTIGYGVLGRLRKGGTFDVERRQLAPGLWQITETHVHIDGRALFFKSIGEQQDEEKTRFSEVPPGTTLAQAQALLQQPLK